MTAADYDRAVKMLAPALNNLVVGGTLDATWLPWSSILRPSSAASMARHSGH